jgi:hypothetical protein
MSWAIVLASAGRDLVAGVAGGGERHHLDLAAVGLVVVVVERHPVLHGLVGLVVGVVDLHREVM